MNVKGDEDRPMGCMPTHLVVPPALEHEGARAAQRGAATPTGATNVYRGTAKLIVSPWLA